MKLFRTAALGLSALAVASVAAYAAGLFPGFPIVGQSAYCTSSSGTGVGTGSSTFSSTTPTAQFGQGAVGQSGTFTNPCNVFSGVGPVGLTGRELIPADTQLASGANPQTVLIPSALLVGPDGVFQGSGSLTRNMLRNGDISANPFQRGTSQAANITSTLTYGADGFGFLGGASSAIQWSSQTGATDIVAGQFTKSLRFQRASGNTDVAQTCEINALTSQDSVALQGQNFVYSFWVKAGANFSPTNGNIVVTVASGTGSDQSAANFKAGSWTNQTNLVLTASDLSTTTTAFPVSVTSGQATMQALPSGATAAWVQVWVSGVVPATATQVGTSICYTPTGTAGANDWIETSNHQLEITAGSVITPSSFEHHNAQFDLTLAQRFFTILTEPAASVQVPVTGTSATTSVCAGAYQFPVTMRAAPTFTALGTALSASTWKILEGAANPALATTFIVTNTANTVTNASLTITTAGTTLTAGTACQLQGAGGGSILSWSAEL